MVENNSVGNRGPKYAAFFPPLTSLLRYGDMESAEADWHEYITLDPEVRTVFGKLSRCPVNSICNRIVPTTIPISCNRTCEIIFS